MSKADPATVLVWHRKRLNAKDWWLLTYLDGGHVATVKRWKHGWVGHVLAPNLTLDTSIHSDNARKSVEKWLDRDSGTLTFLIWDDF